ncbi:hypothetical protein B4U79_03804 [Dinothrombium tinctorium]|uniref:Uncharacterized protein n=1 Tax=Dinothrombium tinctorium TaxID=1965070 RepID=A0A3S3S047_9ACAR|nr:hypothetical protein B4U79_03804 [Dinothrombium tinctorium]
MEAVNKAIGGRFVKALITEAIAYIATPLFMPLAIGRALKPPPGLGPEASVIYRFGRYLRNFVPINNANKEETQLKNNFLELLTKHRRNALLTMKQYREAERRNKLIKEKKLSNEV